MSEFWKEREAITVKHRAWAVAVRRALDRLMAMVQREMLPLMAESADPDKVRRYAEATKTCLDKMNAAAAEADAALRAIGLGALREVGHGDVD